MATRQYGSAEGGMPERREEQGKSQKVTGQVREKAGELGEKARGMGERVRERASETVESGKARVAGRIDRAGQRLEERAHVMEEEGGVKGTVGGAVHRAGDALESGADYVRTTGIGSMRDGLKGQIREHPFISVGVALGTGFALGRVFGGEDEEEERREREEERREREEARGREGGLVKQARGPLGRALVGGMTTMAARRIRRRIGGRS